LRREEREKGGWGERRLLLPMPTPPTLRALSLFFSSLASASAAEGATDDDANLV
jgi:hypothetical protein